MGLPYLSITACHIAGWEEKFTASLRRLAKDSALPEEIASEANDLANKCERFADMVYKLYH